MITTTTLAFPSRGVRCTGWLTRPDGPGPHPAVVLAHGFGANHSMALETYEQHFAAAGIATLAFDYRHLGVSDGQPRQRLSLSRHRQDLVAALDHVRGLPGIDADRVGLWGTSLGAMHVLRALTSATRSARRLQAPLLVCVSRRETLIDPLHVEEVARRAPRGEARHYDGDHFAIYHPPLVGALLADQTAFLREHLHVA